MFVHLIQLRAESRSCRALRPSSLCQTRCMGREAAQGKPGFAQPLNTCKSMKVLFLLPKPGCAGAENELLLQLVLFLVFCCLHSVSAVIASGEEGRGVANFRKQKSF